MVMPACSPTRPWRRPLRSALARVEKAALSAMPVVGAGRAVAVGDLVAERGAHARLEHDVGDDVEAAADGARGSRGGR